MSTNDKLADALRLASNRLRRLALECPHGSWIGADAIEWAKEAENAALAAPPAQGEWAQGAPSKPWSEEWFIAVTTSGDRVVLRALPESYTYDFTTADDTHIKRDRIAKWMQFPDSEFIAPQPAPAPVQVDVLGELADEIEATYPNADASNLRAFAAQPPASGEAELPPLPVIDEVIRFLEAGMPTPTGGFNVAPERFFGMLHDFKKARAAIAALAQQRVPDAVRELPEKWRKDARELGRSGDSSGIWNRTSEQRADELESALATIDQQQEACGNGE